jgi:hypothetical protein
MYSNAYHYLQGTWAVSPLPYIPGTNGKAEHVNDRKRSSTNALLYPGSGFTNDYHATTGVPKE